METRELRPQTKRNEPAAPGVGARLRAARLRAGLTQRELAGSRYSKAYVSALENGQSEPSLAALNFFAERLGLPSGRLLQEEEPAWERLEADVLLAAGEWQAALTAYDRLIAEPHHVGSRPQLLLGRAEALCRLDRGSEAIAPASEAMDSFERAGRDVDAALACYWVAAALYLTDVPREARSLFDSLLDRLRAGLAVDADFKVRVLIARAAVEVREENYKASLGYLEEARILARDLDDRRRATFLFSLAASYREAGDFEGALRTGLESLGLYRAAGAELEAASIENTLALAYLELGNIERAERFATDAVDAFVRLGDDRWLAHARETQAQIALAGGDLKRAFAAVDEAIELSDRTNNRKAKMSALLTKAKAEARQGVPAAALEAYAEAARLAEQSDSDSRSRKVLRDWADLLASLGRHDEAYRIARSGLGPA